MPRVWNKRDPDVPADAVYVGRPTKWGNPYTHIKGKTKAKFHVPTKEAAIGAYVLWLTCDPKNAELLAAVKTELRGKDLVCWCAPFRCHADVLLQIANEESHALRGNLDAGTR